MALDLAYWQTLGNQLGWKSNFRDPAITTDCEPRERGYVDYLIIHHTATTDEAGAVALMQPNNSREVSANRVLGTDGKFRQVVWDHLRAWTSASWLDDIADTVETVNTTSGPEWGIADIQKMALAIWAVEKFKGNRLKTLSRQHIIGHYEVLGISGDGYATACPGPSMNLDLIVELAQAINKGLLGPGKTHKEDSMGFKLARNTKGTIEFRDENGTENLGVYGTGLDNARLIAAAADVWGIEDAGDDAFAVARQITERRNSQIAQKRQAELKAILAPLVAASVAEALANVVIPAPEAVDYAKLAKAVNDDAATRLAS